MYVLVSEFSTLCGASFAGSRGADGALVSGDAGVQVRHEPIQRLAHGDGVATAHDL